MQKVREKLLQQIETIQTTLDIKKKELADVEQAIKREYDSKPFYPIEGDKYYYVTGDGEVFETIYIRATRMDKIRVKNGNCFRTEEKAQEYAQKVLDVFSDRRKKPILKIMDNGFEIYRGILGEEVPHIIYEDGSIAHVGDVVDVIQKDSIRKYRTYIFKDDDYTKGAIMGYASPTGNQSALNNFYKQYEVHKIIDYSRLKEGYTYPNDKAEIRAITKGECDNE